MTNAEQIKELMVPRGRQRTILFEMTSGLVFATLKDGSTVVVRGAVFHGSTLYKYVIVRPVGQDYSNPLLFCTIDPSTVTQVVLPDEVMFI